jgi:acyl-CoA thioesterase-2
VDFHTMMALERTAPDTYVGSGATYPWGGLYGGHIVAQALRAAAATVDAEHPPHSLHAYFIRRGDQDEPVTYEVDELRDGRSFMTRRVVARQTGGAILNLAASFQVHEDEAVVQTAVMPDVPGPSEIEHDTWSTIFERAIVPDRPTGDAAAWLRITDDLGADALLHAVGLTYLSDDFPTDTVVSTHPVFRHRREDEAVWESMMSASLDHAVWFHRPLRADAWHLHHFTCHALGGARGLSIGHIFAADGTHAATVAQEVLLRHRTP